MSNSKDDNDYDSKVKSIDFGNVNNTGRQSVAIGRSAGGLGGLKFGA